MKTIPVTISAHAALQRHQASETLRLGKKPTISQVASRLILAALRKGKL